MPLMRISRDELVAEFGAGWMMNLMTSPPVAVEVLRRFEQPADESLTQEGLFETAAAAIEDYRAGVKTLLDAKTKQLAAAEVEPGILRHFLPAHRNAHRCLLHNLRSHIQSLEESLDQTADYDRLTVPLPETMTHYGRLPVGTPI